jgi:hypothetical protein
VTVLAQAVIVISVVLTTVDVDKVTKVVTAGAEVVEGMAAAEVETLVTTGTELPTAVLETDGIETEAADDGTDRAEDGRLGPAEELVTNVTTEEVIA